MIAAALLAALALAPAAPPATASRVPSTTVGVSAREFAFSLYRPAAPRGRVTFVVHNFGEDDHDLRVEGPRGYRSATSPDIEPAGTLRYRVRLNRPGRYVLVCTKPGHLSAGMRATLRVR